MASFPAQARISDSPRRPSSAPKRHDSPPGSVAKWNESPRSFAGSKGFSPHNMAAKFPARYSPSKSLDSPGAKRGERHSQTPTKKPFAAAGINHHRRPASPPVLHSSQHNPTSQMHLDHQRQNRVGNAKASMSGWLRRRTDSKPDVVDEGYKLSSRNRLPESLGHDEPMSFLCCDGSFSNASTHELQSVETARAIIPDEPLSAFNLSEVNFSEEDFLLTSVDAASLVPSTPTPPPPSKAMVVSANGTRASRDFSRRVTSAVISDRAEAIVTPRIENLSSSPMRSMDNGSLFCERQGELVLNLETVQSGTDWAADEEQCTDAWSTLSNIQREHFRNKADGSFPYAPARSRAASLDQASPFSVEKLGISVNESNWPADHKHLIDEESVSRPHRGSESETSIDSTCWLKSVPLQDEVEAEARYSAFLSSARVIRPEYYLPLSKEEPVIDNPDSCAYRLPSPKAGPKAVREGLVRVARGASSPQRQYPKPRQSPEAINCTGNVAKVGSTESSPVLRSRRSLERPLEPPYGSLKSGRAVSPKPSGDVARRSVSRDSRTSRSPSVTARHSAFVHQCGERTSNVHLEDDLKAVGLRNHRQIGNTREKLGRKGEYGSQNNLERIISRRSFELDSSSSTNEWQNSVCDLVRRRGNGQQSAAKSVNFPLDDDHFDSDYYKLLLEVRDGGDTSHKRNLGRNPNYVEDTTCNDEASNKDSIESLVGMPEFDGKEGIPDPTPRVKEDSMIFLGETRLADGSGNSKVGSCGGLTPVSEGPFGDLFRDGFQKSVVPSVSEFLDEIGCGHTPYDNDKAPCFEDESLSSLRGLISTKHVQLNTEIANHTVLGKSPLKYHAALKEFGRVVEELTENKLQEEAKYSCMEVDNGNRSEQANVSREQFLEQSTLLVAASRKMLDNSESSSITKGHEMPLSIDISEISENGEGGSVSDDCQEQADVCESTFVGSISQSQDLLVVVSPKHKIPSRVVRSLSFSEEERQEAGAHFLEESKAHSVYSLSKSLNSKQFQEVFSRPPLGGMEFWIKDCGGGRFFQEMCKDGETCEQGPSENLDGQMEYSIGSRVDECAASQGSGSAPFNMECKHDLSIKPPPKLLDDYSLHDSINTAAMPVINNHLDVEHSVVPDEMAEFNCNPLLLKEQKNLASGVSGSGYHIMEFKHVTTSEESADFTSHNLASPTPATSSNTVSKGKDHSKDCLAEDYSNALVNKEAYKILTMQNSGINPDNNEDALDPGEGHTLVSRNLPEDLTEHSAVVHIASTAAMNKVLKIEDSLSEDFVLPSVAGSQTERATLTKNWRTGGCNNFTSTDLVCMENELYVHDLVEKPFEVPRPALVSTFSSNLVPTGQATAWVGSLPMPDQTVTEKTAMFAGLPDIDKLQVLEPALEDFEDKLPNQHTFHTEEGKCEYDGTRQRKHSLSGYENSDRGKAPATLLSIYKNPLWSEELCLDFERTHKDPHDQMMHLPYANREDSGLITVESTRTGGSHLDVTWNTYDCVTEVLSQLNKSPSLTEGCVSESGHFLEALGKSSKSKDFPSDCVRHLKNSAAELRNVGGETKHGSMYMKDPLTMSNYFDGNLESYGLERLEFQENNFGIFKGQQQQATNLVMPMSLTVTRYNAAYSSPVSVKDAIAVAVVGHCDQPMPINSVLAAQKETTRLEVECVAPLQLALSREVKHFGSLDVSVSSHALEGEIGSDVFFRHVMEGMSYGTRSTNLLPSKKLHTDSIVSEDLAIVGKERAVFDPSSITAASCGRSNLLPGSMHGLEGDLGELHLQRDKDKTLACKFGGVDTGSHNMVKCLDTSSQNNTVAEIKSSGPSQDILDYLERTPDCQHSETRRIDEIPRHCGTQPSQHLLLEGTPNRLGSNNEERLVHQWFSHANREHENSQVKISPLDVSGSLTESTVMEPTDAEAGEDVKQVTHAFCDAKESRTEAQDITASSPKIHRDFVSTWGFSFFSYAMKVRSNCQKKEQQVHFPNKLHEGQEEMHNIEEKVQALEAEIDKFKDENKKLQKLVKCLSRKMRRLQHGLQVKRQPGSNKGFMKCMFSFHLRKSRSTTSRKS